MTALRTPMKIHIYISLLIISITKGFMYEVDFVYPLENKTITQGKNVAFACVVNNLGKHRLAWIKTDTKAILAIHDQVLTNNGRLSLVHNDLNTWTLIIKNIQWDDRGEYMCQLNSDPMKMQTGFLEILIPPDIIYDETSGDSIITEGESVTLVCKARGFPKPTILWKREDGNRIISKNKKGLTKHETINGDILILKNLTRFEMGTYLCIAANGVPPTVSKRITLYVHFHPHVQASNQLMGATLNSKLTIDCYVEAYPKSINFWRTSNGTMITSNEKYHLNETHSSEFRYHVQLSIRNISKSDLTKYTCISKNSIGESENSIQLYVILNLNLTIQELDSPNKIAINVKKTTDLPDRQQLFDFIGTEIPKLANKSHYENWDIFKYCTFLLLSLILYFVM